jgi:tRNA1(Val) A37 N6-methylase TrmN6
MSLWEVFSAEAARGQRFRKGVMSSKTGQEGHDLQLLVERYPWSSIQKMVDVGGSHGSVSIAVAKRYQNIRCVVQDLPNVVVEGASILEPELKDQIEFMAQ